MNDNHGLSPNVVETVAGFTAGVVSTLAVHPLDIIKTRLQGRLSPWPRAEVLGRLIIKPLVDHASPSALGSSARVARSIVHNEGSLALYRGLTPNIVGNSAGWALYFLWYGQLQRLLQTYHGTSSPLSSLDYLTASAGSGLLSAVLTNPIWVVKTRMLSTSASHHKAYPSMTAGLRSLVREEGARGLFRGLLPSLLGVSHGALYFVAYEKLKQAFRSGSVSPSSARISQDENVTLSNMDYLLISALSKTFAGTLTYPHQVVRARLQTYDHVASGSVYTGIMDVLHRIWHREGFPGFWKGIGPNLLRVVPSTCVTFLVYENVKWYLPRAWQMPNQGARKDEAEKRTAV